LPAPVKAGAAAPVKAAAARATKAGPAPPRAAASAAAPSAPSAAASTEAAAAAAAAAAAEAAAEAAAAAAAAAAAEAAGTGTITVVYCESSPTFTIAGGQLTAEAIDDTLALTHAYPGCAIHLTQAPVRGNDWRTVDWTRLEARSPEGLFSGLLAGARYWAAVVEDGAERARYEAQQRERRAAFAARAAAAAAARCSELKTDYQLSLEACSCIEGNPCAVPECCQDFSGRFENARRVLEDRRRRKEDQAASLGGSGGSSGAVSLAEKERLQREGMDRLAGHSYKKL
jgi:hypothetical protein